MKRAVFAGSFDPFTIGHMDVLRRAAALFDEVHVGVLVNPEKHPLFSPEERCAMIRSAVRKAGIDNAPVSVFSGLLVDFARLAGAAYNVRGLRNGVDFDYEYSMEYFNRRLSPELETVYLASDPAHVHISSSAVRMLMASGADISGLVPDQICKIIAERVRSDEQ